MIKKVWSLSGERSEVAKRIRTRQDEFRHHGQRLRAGVDNYLGSPSSLAHAFLAGFLLDQARPLVPEGPSPVKFMLPWVMRWLD